MLIKENRTSIILNELYNNHRELIELFPRIVIWAGNRDISSAGVEVPVHIIEMYHQQFVTDKNYSFIIDESYKWTYIDTISDESVYPYGHIYLRFTMAACFDSSFIPKRILNYTNNDADHNQFRIEHCYLGEQI